MTPFRSHGKGSFVIKGTWAGVRIERASGTTDNTLYKKLTHMLDTLADAGRTDVLAQVANGKVKLLELWRDYRGGNWEKLPTSAHIIPLLPALEAWWRDIPGEQHQKDAIEAATVILAVAPDDATLSDVPDAVRRLRVIYLDRGRQFKKVRDTASAFLRAELSRAHPLWLEVRAIESVRVKCKLGRHPQDPDAARAICASISPTAAKIWWTLCCTGMGPKEYWKDGWSVEDGHLRIHGKKRSGRDRLVPLITDVEPPTITKWGFTTALRRSGFDVTPYDARRTFAYWMELGRIWDTHQKAYLGHGPRTITDLYRGHDVTRFLDEDAEKLRQVVGLVVVPEKGTPRKSMRRVGFEPTRSGLKVRLRRAQKNPRARKDTSMDNDGSR